MFRITTSLAILCGSALNGKTTEYGIAVSVLAATQSVFLYVSDRYDSKGHHVCTLLYDDGSEAVVLPRVIE